MTSFTERLDQCLAERRLYGGNWAAQANQVRPFAAFADSQGAERITTELFLRWKEEFGSAGRSTWTVRLAAVRVFATWLQGIDPRTEVPPLGLVPGSSSRARPYIFSEAEIRDIVAEAARLPSCSGLRGLTHSTLFGLLAVTGMRIGEAVALDGRDVDLDNGFIRIRHAKGGRSRIVPITGCTSDRLRDYRARMTAILGRTPDALFCGSMAGNRLGRSTAYANFARVGRRLGLRPPPVKGSTVRGPRLHDLRHAYATKTLLDWFRQGLDVDAEMYKLSTVLGHSCPSCTFWYIEAVPELLALASQRSGTATDRRAGS